MHQVGNVGTYKENNLNLLLWRFRINIRMLVIIPFVTMLPFSTGKETSNILDKEKEAALVYCQKNI